ncbi:MAG TPA: phosphotransferase [Rummeliibacillus sp.]|nr:phosphotransferase [Rummeliibacillus sp.]
MGEANVNGLENVLKKFNNVANEVVKNYSFLSEMDVLLLDYSENSTYLIEDKDNQEKYILRVSRPNYHTKNEIEGEIAWLQTLHEQSPIEVSLPIANDDGEYVQTCYADDQVYYCTLFTFLEGDTPDDQNESALIDQFEILGSITAQIHHHIISQHEKYSNYNRLTWDYDAILGENPKWARWQDGQGITTERLQLFERVSKTIKSKLDEYGKLKEHFGLIHADLRLANLIIDGNQIKVIDFDDCGFGWYLYDLASSLSFIEHQPYVPDLIKAWINGYTKIRSLSEEDIDLIPSFIMMRRLQLISWIGSRNNETTKLFGENYTIQTDALAQEYLSEFE